MRASEYFILVNQRCWISLSQDGFAALHVACQEGHDRVAEMLLKAGASVELKTKVRWGVKYFPYVSWLQLINVK